MKQAAELRTLGDRLRWVRQRHGLSLEQFGQRIDCGRSYLSKLERGVSMKPSLDFLDSVCRSFAVSFDWLHSGKGAPFLTEKRNNSAASQKLIAPTEDEIQQLDDDRISSDRQKFVQGKTVAEMLDMLIDLLTSGAFSDALTIRSGADFAKEIRKRYLKERSAENVSGETP